MKILLTICALAAGAGLYATSDSVQADHFHHGRGYRYTSPVYNGRRSYDYGHGHHHQHYDDHGRYSSRSYRSHGHDGGWGYGGYDYGHSNHGHYNHGNYGYRSGFGLQTPSFGLYIR